VYRESEPAEDEGEQENEQYDSHGLVSFPVDKAAAGRDPTTP